MNKKEILEHHTLEGEFTLSSGKKSTTYIDLRSALLCRECRLDLINWYDSQIMKFGNVDDIEYVVSVVGTGVFGAMLSGEITNNYYSIIWNPKNHGVEWSGDKEEIEETKQVVLVDDVKTSGNTLKRLKEACEGRGWKVIGEIVYVENSS